METITLVIVLDGDAVGVKILKSSTVVKFCTGNISGALVVITGDAQGVVCDCQPLTPATTGYMEKGVVEREGYFGLGLPSFIGTKMFLCMIVVFRGNCIKLFGTKRGSRTVKLADSTLSGCLTRWETMLAMVIAGLLIEIVVG